MEREIYQKMQELEDRHWWFVGRRRIVATLLDMIKFRANAKLLDLGCGTGGNLEMLSNYGSVTGVEMDATAARFAMELGHAPVLPGRLPNDLPLEEGSFDCVTMLDVLEHITEDAASLEAVNRLLVPQGHLVLTVPAFNFLWGPHDGSHHHKRRYRAPALRNLLQEAGFRVERLSYYNTWLFPTAAIVRLIRKILPIGSAGFEMTMPPKWINRMLSALFASERHILVRARFPFGISLVAVAQKTRSL